MFGSQLDTFCDVLRLKIYEGVAYPERGYNRESERKQDVKGIKSETWQPIFLVASLTWF